MASEKDSSGGFKIQDKRRFDFEGKERTQEEAAQEKAPPQTGKVFETGPDSVSGPVAEGGTPDSQAVEPGEINFSSFILSLATQALMQMGQIAPPEGVQIPVDRGSASQTIDILVMLQSKTRGNLDPEEDRLMEEILHNLRLSFVRSA
jgi:hypothetical protein